MTWSRSLRAAAALPGLAALAVLCIVLFDIGDAHGMRCPSGYQVRGINCCRVARGTVTCARNPRLPDALAPLMADDAFIAPPVAIDDSDLTPEARSSQPAFGPRPITTDPRVLRPEDDVCPTEDCRFDAIRALAAAHRGRAECPITLREHYCRHSMWRDLDLEQRLARSLVLGREFAEEYDLDVRIFPCIAAIETRFLEPLTVSESSCRGAASDQGLPQIIRPTFDLLYHRVAFRSRVVDYGTGAEAGDRGSGDAEDGHLDALFSGIGQSVRHQLELMAAVLAISGLNERRSNYLDALIAYNGSRHSIGYGYRVNACFQCLKERVDMERFEMRGDPLRCLGAALGGGDLRRDFAAFRALCD